MLESSEGSTFSPLTFCKSVRTHTPTVDCQTVLEVEYPLIPALSQELMLEQGETLLAPPWLLSTGQMKVGGPVESVQRSTLAEDLCVEELLRVLENKSYEERRKVSD